MRSLITERIVARQSITHLDNQVMTQSTKIETKGAKSFKKVEKVRPRKVLARLVIADTEDELNLSRAYLAELLENPKEYVEYWEDSLCFSADAKILYEEYDPTQDEVALPYTLDPSDDISVDVCQPISFRPTEIAVRDFLIHH